MTTPYIGRFAPSPSGPLHFGSLIAAVGSYLRARAQDGQWLVRIEDIDPPREVAGAADQILRTLEAHGLHWDGELVYQSQRSERYDAILQRLTDAGQCYPCSCTRKRIQAMGGVYDGHCHRHGPESGPQALRLHNTVAINHFNDGLLGPINTDAPFAGEDFILKRRDGLYAYQLAVVVDDHDQGITEVVRGNDLLEATVRQCTLFTQLGWTVPAFLHLPLAVWSDGNKLSKQNHAPALDDRQPSANLVRALAFLGQATEPDWQALPPDAVLAQAVSRFDLSRIPRQRNLPAPL
ncbi:tRNA glutamyl-Q(34) synthetase GluQRS [Ferrimonas balearica]|uniref:tRNA glutamyl-Q(34) synthetase GluQRS n=1 Tax=Ferrimonas balearica TaxID=44012 RepID=UPI001F30AFF8|nr:tRNA glutamyl-Q(34) synthetase GluQRS [Ferrimonas balearica]MBY6017929.1 tRNA glutamyl-Q(34) synthetase GluQRS [Halomonas denitrificans]MBY6094264.1 tRNA glutamyl-Q(34) synthetase GluQRS [Ferrimonas balearica]